MPAYARREIVDHTEVGIYHCVSRCVRRAFLCGEDALTGRNFDHRKDWIRDRLEELAGAFAIDVLGFAVMSNHLHVMVRIRPDLSSQLSNEEVARRWLRIFRKRRDAAEAPNKLDARELAMLLADSEAVAMRRGRLADLSWFMRALCEPIARRANLEDGVSGRFFEGRFKSQAVLDESAALACSIYVDLNPIRAGIADTPESSEYTAAYERIVARRLNAAEQAATEKIDQAKAPRSVAPERGDGWLSPIPDNDVCPASQRMHSPRRASDRGFLPLGLDEYLALLDWTGRQVRADKRGAIPRDLRPILERLSINAEGWVEGILDFGRRFHRVIGRAASIAARARKDGRHWYQGESASRLAFT
jgi:REP element-mobilizing transposase RayT